MINLRDFSSFYEYFLLKYIMIEKVFLFFHYHIL